MRFFSKIVFICNICFIISMIFGMINVAAHGRGGKDIVTQLPWLRESIVLLGLILAIILNSAFVFIILFRKSVRKPVNVSHFIIWFNLLLFPIQVWYQFIAK